MIYKSDAYNSKYLYRGFFRDTYGIYFEDSLVREFTGIAADLDQFIFLLNTAYAMGYNSGEIVGSLK